MWSARGRVRVHPYTSIVVAVWGIYSTYTGCPLPALVLGLSLLYLSGGLRRVSMLTLWIVLPVFLIVGIVGGVQEAILAGVNLTTVLLVLSASLLLVDPLELGYAFNRIGFPPIAGILVVIVLRVSEYMGYVAREARAGLHGRGLRGLRLLLSLPIPLIVHAFNMSSLVGEALVFKYPTRGRSWYSRPKAGLMDYVVLAFVGAALILCYMGHFSIL